MTEIFLEGAQAIRQEKTPPDLAGPNTRVGAIWSTGLEFELFF